MQLVALWGNGQGGDDDRFGAFTVVVVAEDCGLLECAVLVVSGYEAGLYADPSEAYHQLAVFVERSLYAIWLFL